MTANRYGSSGLDQEVSRQVKALIATTPGVSVSSIASTLDMRRATLSARVNGHQGFTPSLLSKVAAALGTSAAEIVREAERSVARASDMAA